MSLYSRYVSTFFNDRFTNLAALSKEKRDALHALKTDKTYIVSKPDKGNGVVILNRSEYVDKMNSILSDARKFVPSTTDNNITNLSRFQRCLPI